MTACLNVTMIYIVFSYRVVVDSVVFKPSHIEGATLLGGRVYRQYTRRLSQDANYLQTGLGHANELVGTGFASRYWLQPKAGLLEAQ